jgi:hypothetical protein
MEKKRRIRSVVIWLPIITIALLPIGYSLCHVGTPGFLENFMGNWAATMIGAVIGIPIALWLSRRQQREQEKRELETQQQEAVARKAKILNLIRSELQYNRDQLMESKTETNHVVFINGLKDELWSAFSDGGELEWIRDLQLLYDISFAYHYVRRLIYLEKMYLEIEYYPGTRSLYGVKEELVKQLVQIDPDALKCINHALEAIERNIGPLSGVSENQ